MLYIATQSFDAMQGTIARQKLAAYPPDFVVEIARNACGTLEFDRADEMIALGYENARHSLTEIETKTYVMPMNIRILQLIKGAKAARGLTVVIDVFRAFSTACYVFGNGAERIIPLGDLDFAYKLKKENPSFCLIGERNGERQPGFDYGNSPAEIEHVDFSARTVVQTTSAGTQGIANAAGAEEIISGSFCNAGAIIRHIQAKQPEEVSLVCMGHGALAPSDEDTLCAEYIKETLEGKQPDFQRIYERLKHGESGKRFFDPQLTWSPEGDFDLCLDLDRFDFVLRVHTENSDYPELRIV